MSRHTASYVVVVVVSSSPSPDDGTGSLEHAILIRTYSALLIEGRGAQAVLSCSERKVIGQRPEQREARSFEGTVNCDFLLLLEEA